MKDKIGAIRAFETQRETLLGRFWVESSEEKKILYSNLSKQQVEQLPLRKFNSSLESHQTRDRHVLSKFEISFGALRRSLGRICPSGCAPTAGGVHKMQRLMNIITL